MQHQPITRKLYGLDHLRAFAITFVFLFHYNVFSHPQWISTISSFGWTGVDLFFVLSGFLIAGQLFAEDPISLKTFYTKRVFRIFPAYFFIVALYFLFPYLRERDNPAPLWKFITFTQNLGLDLKNTGAFSHAWSLCIEEQFYLLLPILIIFFRNYRLTNIAPWFIASLFLAGFGVRYYCWNNIYLPATTDNWVVWYKWIYYPTFSRLDGLLVGISLAAIKERLYKYSTPLLIGGLLILAGAYIMCEDENLFNESIYGFPLIAIGYGCVVAAAASPDCFLYRHGSPITRSLAALSYALYLSHKIVIHVTQKIISQWGIDEKSTTMFVICALNCLLAAWLIRWTIEKPFLRWRDKVLSQERL